MTTKVATPPTPTQHLQPPSSSKNSNKGTPHPKPPPTETSKKLSKPIRGVGLNLRPSEGGALKDARSLLSGSQDNKHIYVLEEMVKFNGMSFICKLQIPVATRPSSPSEKEALNSALREWRNTVLNLAKEKAEGVAKDHPLLTGADWEAMCTDQDSVVIGAIDKSKVYSVDPSQSGVDELIEQGYYGEKPIKIEKEEGAALSKALTQSNDPKEIRKTLSSCKALKKYCHEPEKPESKPKVTACLARLKNLGNSCYLNSAYYTVITNPPLFEHLLANPDGFKNGKENPFYKALQQTNEIQISGKETEQDLSDLKNHLGLEGTAQDDAHRALVLLGNQLQPNAQSLLTSEKQEKKGYQDPSTQEMVWVDAGKPNSITGFETQPITPKEGAKLEDLLKEVQSGIKVPVSDTDSTICTHAKQEYLNQKAPKVLVVQAKRQITERTCPDDHKIFMIDELKTHLKDDQLENIFGALHNTFKKDDATKKEKCALADQFLKSDERFEALSRALTKELKDKLYQFNMGKNNASIKIPSTMTLPKTIVQGDPPKYILQSFCSHLGSDGAGHYCIYSRGEDGKPRRFSDTNVTILTEEDFKQAAKKASYWVYNQEKINSSSKKVENADEPKLQVLKTFKNIEGSQISLEIAQGKLLDTPQKAVIVNPTNAGITKYAEEVAEQKGIKKLVQQARIKRAAEERKWYKFWKKKNEHKLNSGSILTSPDILETGGKNVHTVYHICLEEPATEQSMKTLVHKAMDHAMENNKETIVFPLIPTGEDSLKNFCKAVETYAKKRKNDIRSLDVKLVLKSEKKPEEKKQEPTQEPTQAPQTTPEQPSTASTTKIDISGSIGNGQTVNFVTKKNSINSRITKTKNKEDFLKNLQSFLEKNSGNATIDLRNTNQFEGTHFALETYGLETGPETALLNLQRALKSENSKFDELKVLLPEPEGEFKYTQEFLKWLLNQVQTIRTSQIKPTEGGEITVINQTAYPEAPIYVEATSQVKGTAPFLKSEKNEKGFRKALKTMYKNMGKFHDIVHVFDLRPVNEDSSNTKDLSPGKLNTFTFGYEAQEALDFLISYIQENPPKVQIKVVVPREIDNVDNIFKIATLKASKKSKPKDTYLTDLNTTKWTGVNSFAGLKDVTVLKTNQKKNLSGTVEKTSPEIKITKDIKVIDCRKGTVESTPKHVQQIDSRAYTDDLLKAKLNAALQKRTTPITILFDDPNSSKTPLKNNNLWNGVYDLFGKASESLTGN